MRSCFLLCCSGSLQKG
uniref:Uncharacterized protein n=1 Tax=Rhizophora mucronata TaxID=61149 RepID=A0A2P2PMF3_RHIMU